ncbi:hypothetical protein ACC724_38375, partial [Rhizobium ruizarguesonis]
EIIVNNLLDLPPGNLPDLTTPEQYTPRVSPAIASQGVLCETCHTFSVSWGYHRDEDTWKSPEQIDQALALPVGTTLAGQAAIVAPGVAE